MINSMTGYGRSVKEHEGKKYTAEVRSLNSRYFDMNLRMSHLFRDKEIELRKAVGNKLMRGKIDITLTIEKGNGDSSQKINKELIEQYYNELLPMSHLYGNKDQLLAIIMRLPEVVKQTEESIDNDEWAQLLQVLEEALDATVQFRKREGNELEKDLQKRISAIVNGLAEIERLDPKRIKRNKSRLKEQLEMLAGNSKIDESRYEEEIIYYLEKMDITEEKVRLKTHCDYFLEILTENQSSKGKKIGFVSQEIGREINTIGSKSADADMQKTVVGMKDELEKIKEQILNVL